MFGVHCPEHTIQETVILLSLPGVPINLMQSGIKIAMSGNGLVQAFSSFTLLFSLVSLCLYYCVSFTFTPLISAFIFLSACALFYNASTSVQSFKKIHWSVEWSGFKLWNTKKSHQNREITWTYLSWAPEGFLATARGSCCHYSLMLESLPYKAAVVTL